MSEHTNCWCESDVIRCSLPDCPRRPRYFAEQERTRECRKWLDELLNGRRAKLTAADIGAPACDEG